MRIQSLNRYNNNTLNIYGSKRQFFQKIPNDSFQLSFGVLKKNDFRGLDLAIVEKFKAPIQNFKSRDDFNFWAKQETKKYIDGDYPARSAEITAQRKAIVDDWHNYLTSDGSAYEKNPAWELLIMQAITKDLKPNTNKIPPVLNPGALAETISSIQEILKEQPKAQINFLKIYNEKIHEIYTTLLDEDDVKTQNGVWIKIPSKQNDPEHFLENVDKLKALSRQNWCTKSVNAEPYLSEGDFHIYIVDNKSKIGIRFKGDTIEEIQGPRNNFFIPVVYAQEVKDYVEANSYKGPEEEIEGALDKKREFIALKEELAEAIKNKDWSTILKHPTFGFGAKQLDNGLFEIGYYRPPMYYAMSDLGINENELFDNIERITGDLELFESDVIRFKNLKEVLGNVNIEGSRVEATGSLEKIGGNFTLLGSKTTIDDNLIEVGGEIETPEDYPGRDELEIHILENKFKEIPSKGDIFELLGIKYKRLDDGSYAIKEYIPLELENYSGLLFLKEKGITEDDILDGVTQILGDVILECSDLKSFSTVEKIKGNLNINNSSLKDTGALKYVGGDVICTDNCKLEAFGDNFRKIKGSLYAKDSNIHSTNRIRTIEGDCDIRNTPIRQTMYLKNIGGDLDIRGSNIQRIDILDNLEGKIILDSYLAEILDGQLAEKDLWDRSEIYDYDF